MFERRLVSMIFMLCPFSIAVLLLLTFVVRSIRRLSDALGFLILLFFMSLFSDVEVLVHVMGLRQSLTYEVGS